MVQVPRHVTVWLTALVVLVASHSPGSAQTFSSDPPREPALIADNGTLRASLDRLYARSAAWRNALELVQKTGRRVFIVTPDRVRMLDPHDGATQAFDPRQLAETMPLHDDEQRVDVVVVVVNVRLIQDMHWSRGPLMDLERDIDRILVHEVYAHAIPYLLAGHMSGRCADPGPGQPASESCAIRRENEVRAELGLGSRKEYGLESLALVHNPRRESFR